MANITGSLEEKDNKVLEDNKEIFITKVILENFLSFQKDEVDFGRSKFVIIVGPNWSGKTSVFQAIKFALGSNERDERYKKWSDFIRNGQDHAMVEIHIQNGEEIIKLRRYVIRGQSPYYNVQKGADQDFKKLSVQDTQQLISALNLNPDNQFAFVSQGKIDAIKNLKPSELCSFLEEGIGLKKLREEILEQKSNVQNLSTDLQSLKSRRNTLSFSLDLLNPKLERLKKKNELVEIKNKYNDELLWANKDKLEKEITSIKEIINNIKLVLEGIKKKKEFSEREIKAYSKKISNKESTIHDLSKRTGELSYKKQELTLKIQNWQNEKIAAKQELDTLSVKINEIKKLKENIEKQDEKISKDL
ncbi:MAG: AAA family ATPase, partial [Candidatus Lokiarchaeia archaeon]|nr:AAA family ATPase [Candidatus Lokiarchaeia archaeon]